jgi:hypothetical protein
MGTGEEGRQVRMWPYLVTLSNIYGRQKKPPTCLPGQPGVLTNIKPRDLLLLNQIVRLGACPARTRSAKRLTGS